jgi:hypothetical protein
MPAPQMWRRDLRAKVSSTEPTNTSSQKGKSIWKTQWPRSSRFQRAWLKKMERAVVFEIGKLGDLNDASQGTAAGTENPGAGQSPEGSETGPSEAGLEGEQEGSKRTDQEVGHGAASLPFIFNN